MRRVPVLVCGNALRGDDGLAAAAVKCLPREIAAMAEIREVSQLEADLLVEPGIEPCVVVDAAVGIPPGDVVIRPLGELARGPGNRTVSSSHATGLADAVALAAAVLGRPLRGTFVGIGAGDFAPGAELTSAALGGLPGAAGAIGSAVRDLARARDQVATQRPASGGG